MAFSVSGGGFGGGGFKTAVRSSCLAHALSRYVYYCSVASALLLQRMVTSICAYRRMQGNVMGAPLRFTPIGAVASAGRLGASSSGLGGARIPINPETQAALVQYHGAGSGGGTGMQGMDAGQEYSRQSVGVTRRRYAITIVALMALFVILPAVLLKMLGLL
eukprot:COSAG02_NODE_582_length_20017_cov_26.599608_12_plen_162_part_00